MNILQIQLEPASGQKEAPPPVAGWLTSSDPKDWLREASRWREQRTHKDLKILAVTIQDEVKGALLILPDSEKWTFGPSVQPVVKVYKNVYTLEGAQLNTSLLENEVNYLFPEDLYLFLPSLGLISFDQEKALAPSAFVMALRSDVSWNHAVPAPPPAPKLSAIVVPLPAEEGFSLESLNEDGIGKDSDQKIKPSKTGSKLAGKVGTGLGIGLAGLAAGPILGLGKLISFIPACTQSNAGGKTPSDFEKLHDWAKRNFKNLTDARQRELNKLMDLMEKDPDLGLRYALPLGGHEARRGRSTPGWQLSERSNRLGTRQGGSASDGWDLDYETRLCLERQYRKAAIDAEENENFERAAYIYGELLNDWANAADALKKGNRHRDAVGIYLHKLKDQRRAAECLEATNQFPQAAELYTELKLYEKAGDLYARLELAEQAESSWRRAVENETNPIDQARITDKKLNDRDGAIRLLDAAWRVNKRPIDCIKKQFTYLLKADRKSQSVQLLEDLIEADDSILAPIDKARICYTLRAEKQSDACKHRAKEGILKLTSESLLSEPNSNATKEFLKELPALEQTDVLLERDANRFSLKNTAIKPVNLGQRNGHIRPSFVAAIPGEARWDSVNAIATNVTVAGTDLTGLSFARLKGRTCTIDQQATQDFAGGLQRVNHIGLQSSDKRAHVFHYAVAQKIHFKTHDQQKNEIQDKLKSKTRILAIGPSGRSDFISLSYTDTGALVLNYHDIHGFEYNTEVLDLAPPEMAETEWHCAERSGHACFSASHFAAWRYPQGKIIPIQLYEPAHKLVFSPSPLAVGVVLCGNTCVSLITPHKTEKEPEFINLYTSERADRPVACYTNNGDIVIACGSDGLVFNSKHTLTPIATFSVPPEEGSPVDISPHGPRGFIVLTSNHKLVSYE